MLQTEFVAQASHHSNTIRYIAPGLGCIVRQQNWKVPELRQIDVTGSFWGLGIFDFNPGTFYFQQNSKSILASDQMVIYLPPFTIFETLTLAGPLSWRGFFSMESPPCDLPAQPTLMKRHSLASPTSNVEIWDHIRSEKGSWIEAGKGIRSPSPIALKTKKTIDATFREDLKISELSREVGVSHEVIDRSFKQTFGMTPQLYRRKLRTAQALVLIVLKGLNVSEACFEVGFTDFDNFSRQFKKTFAISPSRFRPPKRISDLIF